jgi:hypothetical protein
VTGEDTVARSKRATDSSNHTDADPSDERGGHPSAFELVLVPSRILRTLLVIVAVLIALSTAGQLLTYYFPDFLPAAAATLFYVDGEQGLPTLYSTLTLGVSALLLAAITRVQRRTGGSYSTHWGVLSLVFTFLAIDEFASLHERAIKPVRDLLDIHGGPLWFAWVVPAAAALAVFVGVYVPFLRHLPRAMRRRLWTAGLLFVTGALGMELIQGWYLSSGTPTTLTNLFMVTVEETLEMVGVATFLYALLTYIRVGLPDVAWRLRVAPKD